MKKRITAFAMALAMVAGTVAMAAGVEQTISVTPMNLTVNGQQVTPPGADGAAAGVFASQGVTYAPVRYLCELLGIEVEWDKNDPGTVKLAGDITVPVSGEAKSGTFTAAAKADRPKTQRVTVAGRCCESGDLLGENVPLQEVEPGDLLAVLCTGAYNYSMASNYNRVPRPPVVMVGQEGARLVVRRETLEDILKNDLD